MKLFSRVLFLTALCASMTHAAPTGKIVAQTKNSIGVFSAVSGKRLSTLAKYRPIVTRSSFEAVSTETEIQVRNTKTGTVRTVFSLKKPQPLFDAINRAKYPKNVDTLKGGIDPTIWKDQYSWQLSDAVLLPDNSRLFFASNAGTGMGAAGNATWAFFSYDLKKNRLDVLSKLGEQFGRQPSPVLLTKDGKKLLASVSVHSSAIDNPSYVLLVDLLTQNSKELVLSLPQAKNKSNLLNNIVLSPDSKYVAISVFFYSLDSLMKEENFAKFEPKDGDFTTYIFDVQTAKLVRKIPNTTVTGWIR